MSGVSPTKRNVAIGKSDESVIGDGHAMGVFAASQCNLMRLGALLADEIKSQISVLEVASSSAGIEVLAKMETRWKQKLFSRQFGLNAN